MKSRSAKGTLLVEAIVASFLFLFAFIASSQLFDASLRWEASSTSERLAALVAERRLENLRGWVAIQCKTTGFDNLDWASQEVVNEIEPDSPGFSITVRTSDRIKHTAAKPNTGRTNPPPGFYSPCSTFYAQAPTGQDQQQDQVWHTYPYSRDMTDSARLVEITVTWAGGDHEYRLVSLLGDTIAQAVAPSSNFSTSPVVISGPTNLAIGNQANYAIELRLPSTASIPDVTTLWSIKPTSSGQGSLLPLDSSARTVRLTRTSSGTIVLVAKVRYRGKEIVGYSHGID